MHPGNPPPAVLITGCSSGIGLAAALALHRRGYCVWAGVRREASFRELTRIGEKLEGGVSEGQKRWHPLRLDVARPEDVEAAFRTIAQSRHPLRAVINNAGYGQFGALEDLTEEEFRRQWEINVAGVWRVIRAALPLLRAGGGRGATIINVSSILGRVALPFGGPYAASKFAVEALSDSLRVEVARWGIRVVVVEPGPIRTRFNKNAMAALDFSRAAGSPYSETYRKLEGYYSRDRKGELPASAVARILVEAIESPRPKTRYLVTWPAKALAFAKPFLPDRVVDWILRRYMGL